jgi:membrane-bound lytic murein transglycosylase D
MKFLFLFYFFSLKAFSLDHPLNFSNPIFAIEDNLLSISNNANLLTVNNYKLDENLLFIFNDNNNLVNPIFTISSFYYHRAFFWFIIYTQYFSHDVVLHDKENLNLIYKVLSFSQLQSSKINEFEKFHLQNYLVLDQINLIKDDLLKLEKLKVNSIDPNLPITSALRDLKINIPKNISDRSVFFKNLRLNLRSQTGQKDQIFLGLSKYFSIKPFLSYWLDQFKLPKELSIIPLLESSYNNNAISKVKAKGIWQFMDYTSNIFLPKLTNDIDYRLNPYISSLAALHLLKSNFAILKSWDLAITAYNSGTKHLFETKKLLKKGEAFTLENVVKRSKSKNFGFASLNFYAEFLALTRVFSYHESLFKTSGFIAEESVPFIYFTKCRTSFSKLKNKFNLDINLNQHILNEKITHNSSIFFLSTSSLKHTSIDIVNVSDILKLYPKNYPLPKIVKECIF